MDMLLVYLILLAMGFVIVLLAFLMKESWRIKQAEVKIEKLGVDLKVQNNTLIVILGFVKPTTQRLKTHTPFLPSVE